MKNDKSDTSDRESFTYMTFKDLLDNPVELEWIIEGMIMKGDATIIHASGGVGKSTFGLNIALHLAAHGMGPKNPLNTIFDLFSIPERRATLFIQAENSKAALHNKLKLMCEGNKVLENGKNLAFVLCQYGDTTITGKHFSDQDFCAFVVKHIADIEKKEDIKIDLLIIDPLISYHGGNENDAVETRATLDGISQISNQAQCTPFVIHHNKKGNPNSGDSFRGSTAINDWARNRISLKQVGATKRIAKQKSGTLIPKSETLKLIEVTHEKCNNFQLFDSFLLEMGSDLNFRLVEKRLSEQEIEICKKVVKALKGIGGHAGSQNILAKAYMKTFKGSDSTAKRHIGKAEQAGYICKKSELRKGKKTDEYSLPEK